jgi:hypothetical protein
MYLPVYTHTHTATHRKQRTRSEGEPERTREEYTHLVMAKGDGEDGVMSKSVVRNSFEVKLKDKGNRAQTLASYVCAYVNVYGTACSSGLPLCVPAPRF